jgi:peptidoglycan/xylan/chitin deacetylase (PgdA/CDA1 family)
MSPRAEQWRWQLKMALAAGIAYTRSLPLVAAATKARRRPLILGYHRVVEDFRSASRTEMASMLTSRQTLEQHLEWIGQEFRFVSLDEIGQRELEGRPFTEAVAAVTFDDGYRDVYDQAFPYLKARGIPAAVFVVTALIGRGEWQIHDHLYHLLAKGFAKWHDPRRQLAGLLTDLRMDADGCLHSVSVAPTAMETVSELLPVMPRADVTRLLEALELTLGNGYRAIPASLSWPMLQEMRDAGFTIGSHTRTHLSLPLESPDRVREELVESKRDLERGLGEAADHFAYPGGQFSPPVVESTAQAGYRFAYTACPHRDRRHPALTLERLLLWERSSLDERGRFSPQLMSCQAHDLWPPARRCERRHRA